MQCRNVKQKPFRQINAYSCIFTHIQTYSEPCVTVGYLYPWYIQKPSIFRTKNIFRTLAHLKPWPKTLVYTEIKAYLESCKTSTMKRFAKRVNGYNYFHELQLFSKYQLFTLFILYEINIMEFFNTLQKYLSNVKKYEDRGDKGPWILIYFTEALWTNADYIKVNTKLF